MKYSLIFCLVACFSFAILLPDAQAQSESNDLSTVFNYVKISDNIASSGQIPYEQMSALKKEGYDIVINLAPVSESSNALEGFLVAEQQITYLNIPVSWREPAMRDLELFMDVMEINQDRKVYVHCAANMRASVFVYLYRTLLADEDEALARADMEEVWDPSNSPQWAALIESAQSHFAASN
jgi:protein tyrosine phosphatase (PTP) superfamily phosphohydrolase (DUF442 family)